MDGKKQGVLTLGDMVRKRSNNFDLLRLLAALIVLISHSFPLAGKQSATWVGDFLWL